MLRKHSDDQLKHIKGMIKKQGGDISKKLKGDFGDKHTVDTLDNTIDLSDNEPNTNMKTDKQLKNLPKNSLITKFETFKHFEAATIEQKPAELNVGSHIQFVDDNDKNVSQGKITKSLKTMYYVKYKGGSKKVKKTDVKMNIHGQAQTNISNLI